MKKLLLIMLPMLAALLLGSCRGDDGPMGPEGPMGPAGRDGRDGIDGKDGEGMKAYLTKIRNNVRRDIEIKK